MLGQPFNDGWSTRRRLNPFERLGAGTAGLKEVTLPHDAMLDRGRDPGGDPRTAFFRPGSFYYERRLTVPTSWADRHVAVRFEGINRDAVVILNDDVVAVRPYGYSEVVVRLDDRLTLGEENVLRVECRTAKDDSRWYSGAGLYREVSLFVANPVHVALDGLVITTPVVDEGAALIDVAVTVENDTARRTQVRARLEIADSAGEVCARDDQPVTVDGSGTAVLRSHLLVANPRRWGPDDPHLYTCRVQIFDGAELLDEAREHFGIRTVTVDAVRGLRINGETVNLRGACVHHDNGVLGAATIGRAEERRVELLKASGFNALRSAHQPMSRAMLDACDRMGVLVVDEAFDVWREAKREHDNAAHFDAWWERDLHSMVAKDRNHPSVIMYSIGNEIPEIGTVAGAQTSRALADYLRRLDPTRLITNGVNLLFTIMSQREQDAELLRQAALDAGADGLVASDDVGTRTEEAFGAVDVAGYNYAEVRYSADHDRFPNRVIVGSETLPGRIDRLWRLVLDNEHVIGDFTWTGWDYLGEVGIGRIVHDTDEDPSADEEGFQAGFPWRYAWCGDLAVTGDRLPMSYYRETVFGLRREPYLVVLPPRHHGATRTFGSDWAWSTAEESWTWDGDEGRPVTVQVYADADEVELVLDGDSIGRRPAGEEHRFIAEFSTTYRPGELVAIARTGGAEVGRATLRTASRDLRMRLDVDRDRVVADHRDLAFVAISVVDEHGTVHPSAEREVDVLVEGAAVLQGLGTAAPASIEAFDTGRCTTFRGRALAVVRPTEAGSITITVTTDSLAPVTATLEAVAVPVAER